MFAKTSISKVACLAAGSLMLQSCITSAPKAVVTDASVTESKLAVEAVTNGKIGPSAVTTSKIADNAVTTAKILDGAVTTAKLGTIPVSTFTNFIANNGQTGAIVAGPSDANAFQLQTSGTTRMTLASTGSITGGHTNTSTANGTDAIGVLSRVTANPAANSSSNFFGGIGRADWQAAFTSSTDLAGGFFDSGQVTGLRGHVLNSAGAGTITRGFGVDAFVELSSSGTIVNAAGFHADGSIGVGTITNYAGVWLEDITNTTTTAFTSTRYGIFSDGSAVSFFRGNVGIGAGQTSPANPLSVTGAISGTTTITAGTSISAGTDLSAAGCVTASTGNIGGVCASDRGLKKDIKDYPLGLAELIRLQPRIYKFNGLGGTKENAEQVGFIAQEVEKVVPNLVEKKEVVLHTGDKNKTEIKAVNYSYFIYIVLNAVKELYSKWSTDHEQLGNQKEKIAALEKKVEIENLALKAENKTLKDRLEKIELALAQAAPDKSIQKKGRKLAQAK